jgi:hypothetical protein
MSDGNVVVALFKIATNLLEELCKLREQQEEIGHENKRR